MERGETQKAITCPTFVLFDLAPKAGVMAAGKIKKYWSGRRRMASSERSMNPSQNKEPCNILAKILKHRNVGKTNNKMAMIKVASDGRKGLVVESTLVDLMESEKCVTFSVKLTCDDIHNRDCLKAFHGMRLANDTYRSPIKRWASLVEAHADVKRADVHKNKKFSIGMMSRKERIKKKGNAQQLQKTRNVMVETMTAEAVSRTSMALLSAQRTRRCHSTSIRGARRSSHSRTSPFGRSVSTCSGEGGLDRPIPASRQQRCILALWRSLSSW